MRFGYPPIMSLLGINAYAEHRKEKGLSGGSRGAVQKAIKAGRIKATADGKIDPAKADRDWETKTDPGRQRQQRPKQPTKKAAPEPEPKEPASEGERPEADPGDYWKSRAAREYWESELSRLKAERERGSQIVAADAERAWGGMIVAARTKALFIPGQLARKIALETDPVICEEILKDAMYKLLAELSEYSPGS